MSRYSKLFVAVAAVAVAGLTPATSQATILFGTGDGTFSSTNIGAFVPGGVPGTSFTGNLLGSGTPVLDVDTDVSGQSTAQGAAVIERATATPFDTITFATLDPTTLGVTGISLNPRGGTNGTFTLTAIDQFGNSFTSIAFTLNNGNSRVFAQGSDGQVITSLTINSSGNIIDSIRQVRVGDVVDFGTPTRT